MKFARYSSAFLKKKEINYNYDPIYNLIKLIIKKGYKLKAYRIVYSFVIKSKRYFNLLVRNLKKAKIENYLKSKISEKEVNGLIKERYLNIKNLDASENFNFLEMFKYLVENYAPLISFVNRKVAATVYKLPYLIISSRAKMLFLRWFLESALVRNEKSLSEKLLNEFLNLYYGVGRTIKKVEEYYDAGQKNYPFVRFIKRRKKYSKFIKKKYHIRNH